MTPSCAGRRRRRKATEEALAQSEEARKRAEAVLGFLKDDVLAAARPEGQEGGLGVDVTVRKAVDAAEPKIAGSVQGPADRRGGCPRHAGDNVLCTWVMPRWRSGSTSAPLELREAKLGPDHPDTLASRNNLAVAYRRRRPHRRGHHDARGDAQADGVEARPRPPRHAHQPQQPRQAYLAAGRTAEAIKLHEATLKLRESKLGPDHPDTLTSRNNLATAYQAAGRTAEAIPLHEATLKLRESKLGPDHPDTLASRNNLAGAYQAAGRHRRRPSTLFDDDPHASEPQARPDRPPHARAMTAWPDLIQHGSGPRPSHPPRVPGDPREGPARRLEHLQHPLPARRQPCSARRSSPRPSR